MIRKALPTTPDVRLTSELRDTFFVYGPGPWAWLCENEFKALDPRTRAALPAEQRQRTRPEPPVA